MIEWGNSGNKTQPWNWNGRGSCAVQEAKRNPGFSVRFLMRRRQFRGEVGSLVLRRRGWKSWIVNTIQGVLRIKGLAVKLAGMTSLLGAGRDPAAASGLPAARGAK